MRTDSTYEHMLRAKSFSVLLPKLPSYIPEVDLFWGPHKRDLNIAFSGLVEDRK